MKESAYKTAGVDIDAGDDLVERIKPAVGKTFRSGVMEGLGGFGALFDLKAAGYKDPILVSSTDGVGTKIKIAIDANRHDKIGFDLVAMCVNDLIVQGAEPLFFLDYYASGKLRVDVAQKVVESIAAACAESGCALIGGETAEMPGIYGGNDYDLAGFTVGAVERDRLIKGDRVKPGDTVLGLASSGLHSNGFSLVRKIALEACKNYDVPAPFDPAISLGEALLVPTRLYVRPILKALALNGKDGQPAIKSLANITGGGLIGNVPRTLPAGTCAALDAGSWNAPPVFAWLAEAGGLSPEDLAVTFNCGIGMTLVCAPEDAAAIITSQEGSGVPCRPIGRIEAAEGEAAARIDNSQSLCRN